MTKSISILGSTGSIGRQTLEVAEEMHLRVAAITARTGGARFEEQIRAFHKKLAKKLFHCIIIYMITACKDRNWCCYELFVIYHFALLLFHKN